MMSSLIFQRRRARLRPMSEFDIDTYDLPFGVHLPPYTEEDITENSPPTYSQLYPQLQQNNSTNNAGNYQQHENNRTECCASVLNTLPVSQNGGLCFENCPYCASSRQNSANYSYSDYEINPHLPRRTRSNQFSSDQNFNEIQTLVCPALVHNDGQNIDNTESGENTSDDSLQQDQCSAAINPRRFFSRRHCYEVTVNLEWI